MNRASQNPFETTAFTDAEKSLNICNTYVSTVIKTLICSFFTSSSRLSINFQFDSAADACQERHEMKEESFNTALHLQNRLPVLPIRSDKFPLILYERRTVEHTASTQSFLRIFLCEMAPHQERILSKAASQPVEVN